MATQTKVDPTKAKRFARRVSLALAIALTAACYTGSPGLDRSYDDVYNAPPPGEGTPSGAAGNAPVCSGDDECGEGWACSSENVCRRTVECEDSSECESGKICHMGSCISEKVAP